MLRFILLFAALSMSLALPPAFAQDKGASATAAPPTNPAALNPKGTIWDDRHKPVTPNANTKGGVWDDGLKPVAPKAQNPAVNPQGTIWDDTVKPVAPKP